MNRFKLVASVAKALGNKQSRHNLLRAMAADKALPNAECPCCGYVGKFAPAGRDARVGGLCPSCKSYERHRLVALAFRRGFLQVAGREVIHFAPEPAVRPLVLAADPASYVTADVVPGRADRVLNLEQLDLCDASVDVAIASHVLEHVDDRKALAELFRVLKPGGELIAMVPIVEGWAETFEDQTRVTPEERQAYFGRYDHVRLYGGDFRDRLEAAGFAVTEFTAGPVDSVKYRLSRGEKVFLAAKPA